MRRRDMACSCNCAGSLRASTRAAFRIVAISHFSFRTVNNDVATASCREWSRFKCGSALAVDCVLQVVFLWGTKCRRRSVQHGAAGPQAIEVADALDAAPQGASFTATSASVDRERQGAVEIERARQLDPG